MLAAADAGGELELMIETTGDLVPCPECGAVATPKDRRPTWVGDLPIAGRPVVLCWVKRVWWCEHALCPRKTWTEQHPAIAPRAVLTERAAAAAAAQVSNRRDTVAGQARAFGVGWHTTMRQVHERGTPVLEDPARLEGVTAVGLDEHAWQRGGPRRHTATPPGSSISHPVGQRGCSTWSRAGPGPRWPTGWPPAPSPGGPGSGLRR